MGFRSLVSYLSDQLTRHGQKIGQRNFFSIFLIWYFSEIRLEEYSMWPVVTSPLNDLILSLVLKCYNPVICFRAQSLCTRLLKA